MVSAKVKEKVEAICEELYAENITSRPPKFHCSGGSIYGVTNPNKITESRDDSLLLGYIFSAKDDWHVPCTEIPDGNFALFRNNEQFFEAVSDCMATRSLWYYFDDKKLIVSTSQKAIVRFLGDFEFNSGVIPWVLSTGSLGPSMSWDKRIKLLPADGVLRLDKNHWEIETEAAPVAFTPKTGQRENHRNRLKNAIEDTFKNLRLDFSRWAVTLSGGHDSRAILLFIKNFAPGNKEIIKTITWGDRKAQLKKKSDASIARLLSEKEGTQHKYYSIEAAPDSVEKVVDRFLQNGEGRIDHIGGYMDGFDLWKKMFEGGLEGVIRGDEVFGYSKSVSSLMVRCAVGLTLCSDFSNLKKYDYIRGLAQDIPKPLQKKEEESLALWRDRLYHSFRVPVLMASLAELKSSYLDQINPFLSRKIVMAVRDLPDEMRTDKKLFKEIAELYDPGLPFAEAETISSFEDIVERKDFEAIIKKELSSSQIKEIFPEEFLTQVKQNLKSERIKRKGKIGGESRNVQSLITQIKRFIPLRLKIYLSSSKKQLSLNENILGFRVLIISRMYRTLSPATKTVSR